MSTATPTIDEQSTAFGEATWRALGTTALVLSTDPAGIDTARRTVDRELDEIDLAASRFREDSEVSRVAAAGGRTVPVSPLLAAAIAAALRAARLTGGAVDPTVGTALAELGYDRDFAEVRSAPGARPPLVTVRQLPSWRAVELDVGAGTVRVPAGMMIDLGAKIGRAHV